MKTNHPFQWLAAGLLVIGLSACERETITPNDALSQARQSAVAAGANVLHADLPALYRQASKLNDAEWLDLSALTEEQAFPVQRIRRSPMLPRDAKFYTTDGKQLFEQPRPELMVVEGLTADGRRGLFALSPEHFGGWYEAPEGRMYVQDLAFDHPEAETGELVVLSEVASLSFAPPSGEIGQQKPLEEAVSGDVQTVPMPEANCWKLQLLMHGDWYYFSSVAGHNVNNANFGMVAFAVVSDPAFAAINMDLVVSHVTLTQTPTSSSLNVYVLRDWVRGFWSHYPVNRDAVLYVSGTNLFRPGVGYSSVGYGFQAVVCKFPSESVAVAEWQRNGTNGYSNMVCNGRIGANVVGTLLGAQPANSGVMYSGNLFAYPASSSFIQSSRNQMNNHIWYHHNCLHQAGCN